MRVGEPIIFAEFAAIIFSSPSSFFTSAQRWRIFVCPWWLTFKCTLTVDIAFASNSDKLENFLVNSWGVVTGASVIALVQALGWAVKKLGRP